MENTQNMDMHGQHMGGQMHQQSTPHFAPGGRYDRNQHGQVVEDGRWLRNSAIYEFVVIAIILLIGVIAITQIPDFGIILAVYLVFLVPALIIPCIVMYRYIRHNRFLQPAMEHGTVVMGRIVTSRFAIVATWAALGGFWFGAVSKIEYNYTDELGQMQQGRAFVRGFNPATGQPISVLVHNGRSAIINTVHGPM